jgi:hypothetical protein
VSWLDLELYQLGELPADRRAKVSSHLAECPACASCLEHLGAPVALPALPIVRISRFRRVVRRPEWLAVAAAAVFALALWLLPAEDPGSGGIKGGELAMVLVAKRGDAIVESPASFGLDDSFKVLVTCPPGQFPVVRVEVIQGGVSAAPLPQATAFECGNRRPLPGAFRLTGREPARVCVFADERSVCVDLAPLQ